MNRSRAYVAAILAFTLLFSSVASVYGATAAELEASRRKAAEAREEAAQAQARADELRIEVEALDTKIADLADKVHEIEPQIDQATIRTTKLRTEVEQLRASITQKEAEIRRTQADYAIQIELLNARIASSYKQGDLFYLDLVLGAKDFRDLIARTTLVQRVVSSNRDIALQLDDTKTQLERRKVELSRSLETVQAKRAEAEMVEANLRNLKSQRQAALGEQRSAQSQKADLMAANEADASRLRALAEAEEAEAAKIEAELAARSSGGSGAYNGSMAWPVPGFYRITSPFGPRICPFHGPEIHPGIDVGRNTDPEKAIDGAAIVASGDGTVIYTGYRGAYGYTVMIDHGNGLVTLYAHQQGGGIKVSEGQRVSKGERIGTVGSSGNSTGPHLHYETRVNGAPVDPMKYVS